ncbi:hypothetical protein V1290_000365 [Bradyrhizobium sp. AZCC 1578]
MSGKRRSSIVGQWAARTVEMLESPAYRVLSLSAHRVISRIEVELAHHGGKENGRLPVTYENFEEYGIDRQAIAPAIREAEALGFIEVTERGRAGNAEFRKPNRYRLTYRDNHGGYNGTHEWRRFATMQDAVVCARAARRAPADKSRSRCGKNSNFRVGNHTRNQEIHSSESPTTCITGESQTTIDISGRGPLGKLAQGGN